LILLKIFEIIVLETYQERWRDMPFEATVPQSNTSFNQRKDDYPTDLWGKRW
jgi:hypothetical protein